MDIYFFDDGILCVAQYKLLKSFMQEIRYLDKLIDELAKGRPLEKILRAQ